MYLGGRIRTAEFRAAGVACKALILTSFRRKSVNLTALGSQGNRTYDFCNRGIPARVLHQESMAECLWSAISTSCTQHLSVLQSFLSFFILYFIVIITV